MIPKPNNEPAPGEWQEERNPWGGVRRFRICGGVKEYEAEVLTASGVIRESELSAHAQREAARIQAEAEEQRKQATAAALVRHCPFTNSLHSSCKREKCALFADGCAISNIMGDTPSKAASGLICPFSGTTCRTDCALFKNNGCVLTAALRK